MIPCPEKRCGGAVRLQPLGTGVLGVHVHHGPATHLLSCPRQVALGTPISSCVNEVVPPECWHVCHGQGQAKVNYDGCFGRGW